MNERILEVVLNIDQKLSEIANKVTTIEQDIKEIKQKLNEHDNKFDSIAETLD
jgi:hypothetical protein